jgi:hypothetical protein
MTGGGRTFDEKYDKPIDIFSLKYENHKKEIALFAKIVEIAQNLAKMNTGSEEYQKNILLYDEEIKKYNECEIV